MNKPDLPTSKIRPKKLRPKSGFSHLVHLLLTLILPVLVYVLVSIRLSQFAVAIVLLSKWRMFAVRPRYWLAHFQSNAVDMIVGLSTVVFMSATSAMAWRLAWTALYALWLIALKPGSSIFRVSLQAMVAQLVGLMALFLLSGETPLVTLVIFSWLICYLSARHFFTSFEEKYTLLYSYVWAYFAAALVWVLGHLLLFYGALAQPTLLLVVIGYGLATLYYLDHHDRLSPLWRRQFVIMMFAIIAVVLRFSDWGDKAL
jgi:hypothetical protein